MSKNKGSGLLFWLVVAVFLFLLARVFQLQVLQGRENRILAENNRLQKQTVVAPRGLIFDRHGGLLAGNIPQYWLEDKQIEREEALERQADGKDEELVIKPCVIIRQAKPLPTWWDI